MFLNLFSSDLEVKEVEERYNEKLELAVMDIDIGTIKPPNTAAFGKGENRQCSEKGRARSHISPYIFEMCSVWCDRTGTEN